MSSRMEAPRIYEGDGPGGWELRRVELYEERIARNGMGVAVSFGRGTR